MSTSYWHYYDITEFEAAREDARMRDGIDGLLFYENGPNEFQLGFTIHRFAG